MSRHRYVRSNRRKKLAVVVTAGAFMVGSAATAAAVAWPGGSAAAADAKLTGLTQARAATATQHSLRDVALRAEKIATAAGVQAAIEQQAAAQQKQQLTAAENSGTPQRIAAAMLSQFGWSSGQMSCLEPLWQRESGWEVSAYNAGSGAFGIPQALPGGKMASAGADWQTSAATQIKWGLGYIQQVYGSPCGAWDHEEADGWY